MTPCVPILSRRQSRDPPGSIGDIPRIARASARLLISLISEDRKSRAAPGTARRSRLQGQDDLSQLCVETAVRILCLWESSEGGDQDVTYCECYQRADAEAPWDARIHGRLPHALMRVRTVRAPDRNARMEILQNIDPAHLPYIASRLRACSAWSSFVIGFLLAGDKWHL